MSWSPRGDRCWLSLVDERKVKSEMTHDAAMGYLLRMINTLGGSRFAPLEVRITRRLDEKSVERLQLFYDTRVVAGSDAYALGI